MNDRVVLVTASRDSANRLIAWLRNNPQWDHVKFWAEDWMPGAVKIMGRCTEQEQKEITLSLNKYLGLA